MQQVQIIMTLIFLPFTVVNLSATAPIVGSDTELTVSWSPPEEGHGSDAAASISQYYVMVTNYSLDFVTAMTVPANTTSTTISGLGEHKLILLFECLLSSTRLMIYRTRMLM